MEKKPIKFYIRKHVKFPESDDVSLLVQFTLPYEWYKTKPTDEVCDLLIKAFKNSGYFESPYNLPTSWVDPPKEWTEYPIGYFDDFDFFDIPFINDKNEFSDTFNLRLSPYNLYSDSDGNFDLNFYLVMPLKRYEGVSNDIICDNLSKSFKLFILLEKTINDISECYKYVLKYQTYHQTYKNSNNDKTKHF